MLEEVDGSRDPEGLKRMKDDKLTPLGSQDEFCTRAEVEKAVEMDVAKTNLGREPDVDPELDPECMVIDSYPKPREAEPPAKQTVKPTAKALAKSKPNPSKRAAPENETETAANKKPDTKNGGISQTTRDDTVYAILDTLNPLTPPNELPDLLHKTAIQLESALFDRVTKGKVNALGRSSTLVTAGKGQALGKKYAKEVEVLLRKVQGYVERATREDVVLEDVQQGEIWDVIKDILEKNS